MLEHRDDVPRVTRQRLVAVRGRQAEPGAVDAEQAEMQPVERVAAEAERAGHASARAEDNRGAGRRPERGVADTACVDEHVASGCDGGEYRHEASLQLRAGLEQ